MFFFVFLSFNLIFVALPTINIASDTPSPQSLCSTTFRFHWVCGIYPWNGMTIPWNSYSHWNNYSFTKMNTYSYRNMLHFSQKKKSLFYILSHLFFLKEKEIRNKKKKPNPLRWPTTHIGVGSQPYKEPRWCDHPRRIWGWHMPPTGFQFFFFFFSNFD
jgi:hypothetical protein